MQLHPENKAFKQLHREVLQALVRAQAAPSAASSRSSSLDSEASSRKPVREVREEELPSQELCIRASEGDVSEMRRLLQKAEVNWKRPRDGNTALHLAAEMEHLEVLHRALKELRTQAVQLLLEHRADPESCNHFALSAFALAQHGGAVEKLLAQVTKPLGERRYAMQL